jgi:hypothetical protein
VIEQISISFDYVIDTVYFLDSEYGLENLQNNIVILGIDEI